MLTLSYGIKLPEDGDKGAVFFPALEENLQQANDHYHNGNNSTKLTTAAVVSLTSNVLSANWVASGSGYRQLITLPAGLSYDSIMVNVKEASGGGVAHLHIEKASNTTYYVYSNDNSASFVAHYTS